jgi:hypothetical protein
MPRPRIVSNEITLCAARFMVWRSTRGLIISNEPIDTDSDLDVAESLPVFVGSRSNGTLTHTTAEEWN